MKEAIIMTKEEYKDLTDTIKQLQACLREKINVIDRMDANLSCAHERINALWEIINRPAIEAAAKTNEEEFYSWCDEMAEKYDELDWIERMDRKYNPHHSKACWKKWAEEYESPDNLGKAHGWTEESDVYNNNFWIMWKNSLDYKGSVSRTHEHMLYCLMQYFASYGRGDDEDFWKHLLKELYNVDV